VFALNFSYTFIQYVNVMMVLSIYYDHQIEKLILNCLIQQWVRIAE